MLSDYYQKKNIDLGAIQSTVSVGKDLFLNSISSLQVYELPQKSKKKINQKLTRDRYTDPLAQMLL